MNGNRKLTWTKKGLSVGLVLVLLLLTLAPAGQAQNRPQATTQGDASAVWQLPFLRTDHTAIFQHLSNQVQRIIAFGGWNGRQFFNDVWALDMKDPDHAAWTKLNPRSVWPPPRAQHTAIYDEANQRMIVFGGHQAHYNFSDVWALDLSTPGSETWTQLTPGGAPIGARRWHGAVYDAANQRMVVFGGSGRGGLRNDVWALDLSTPGSETWSQLSVTGSVPSARAQHTAIYDSTNGLMIVFGGSDGSTLRNDAWALNLTTLHWAELHPAGDPPPARRKHSAVYYDEANNMLLFGGLGGGGFLNDLWRLRLPPNTLEWKHVDSATGGPPAARAGHTATMSYYEHPMIVLGGRGMGTLAGETQWLYSSSHVSWSQFTPDLPEWWQGGAALKSPQSNGTPDVTLQIEDAPPDTTVSVLPNQEVWFVAKIKTTSATYANDVDVTLDVVNSRFDVTEVGTRYKDADAVTNWTTPTSLGGGRYRLEGVDLERRDSDSKYHMQVVFKATVKATADPGRTPITVVAEGTNWLDALDHNAQAVIRQDPRAWIIVNRTQLFEQYDNSEVRRLLDKTFEIAQGGAENNNGPAAVVLYADRYVPELTTWDNTTVDYTNETTANEVAEEVADWLTNWVIEWGPPMVYAYPNYLVVLGDDNLIPFYRKYDDTNGEGAEAFVVNADPVLMELVDNNYYFTDNPYGDRQYGSLHQDWETGGLESAVGRVVGASAADMEKALQNGVRAPNPESGRVIIASGQDLVDWQLPGGQNDALYFFNLMNYNYNASLVDDDPSKTDVTREMAKGFDALLLGGHGTVYGWIAPGGAGPDWPDNPGPEGIDGREMAEYDANGDVSAGRIFYHFMSCRTGFSHTSQGPYDSMVYALTHHEASGGVASAGLACCVSADDALSPAEALSNDFWVVAAYNEHRSDPLGWALKQAKRRFTFLSAYSDANNEKTVQEFTFFGLPWMRMPGAPTTTRQAASSPRQTPAAWSMPRPTAPLATFVMTTTVDASTYAVTQTVEGFDLIQVEGMGATFGEGQPVLPLTTIELMLPLSATVTSLTFTPTQEVALNNLDIPSLQFETGSTAITATYTNTVDGVYPVTATFESSALDTYQLVQVHVIPVTYDATNDQATLYRNIEIAVEYDTPETIGLTFFEPDELQYLPGETISTTTHLVNVGDVTETVTATLFLQDTQGQIVGLQGAGPFDVPAGGAYDLKLGWTGALDGDVYLARIFIWRGGQAVAGGGAAVSITGGEVSAVTVPETLMPGEAGTFALTFDNLGTSTSIALASLAIYDQDDTLVAFLPAQAAVVAGGGSTTLSFQWTPDQGGSYTVSFMLSAGGQEYGPHSQSVEVGHRVYLPLTFKNHQ